MCRLRVRLSRVICDAGAVRSGRSRELIGCDPAFLRSYLEAKFKPGMSWERRAEIHIDHILPCSAFDLTDPEQQRWCFHYSNLQPLWAAENIQKADLIPQPHQAFFNLMEEGLLPPPFARLAQLLERGDSTSDVVGEIPALGTISPCSPTQRRPV